MAISERRCPVPERSLCPAANGHSRTRFVFRAAELCAAADGGSTRRKSAWTRSNRACRFPFWPLPSAPALTIAGRLHAVAQARIPPVNALFQRIPEASERLSCRLCELPRLFQRFFSRHFSIARREWSALRFRFYRSRTYTPLLRQTHNRTRDAVPCPFFRQTNDRISRSARLLPIRFFCHPTLLRPAILLCNAAPA